jgi:hypothetical protein
MLANTKFEVLIVIFTILVVFISAVIFLFIRDKIKLNLFKNTNVGDKNFPLYNKPFFMTGIIVISILLYTNFDTYYNYFKTPLKHRWVLNYMDKDKRIKDIIANPKKYQNVPCLDVFFANNNYCFDRSIMTNIDFAKSIDRLIFSFIIKTPNQINHSIRLVYYDYNDSIIKKIINNKIDEKLYNKEIKNHNSNILNIKKLIHNIADTRFANVESYFHIENNTPDAYIEIIKNTKKDTIIYHIEQQSNTQNGRLSFSGVADNKFSNKKIATIAYKTSQEIRQFIQNSQIQ